MLTIALVVIHVAISAAIIVLVLLHSGRGGGVSDMFGGGVSSTAAGSSVVERNLDRVTVAFVIAFAFTTMALAILLQ